ncbi:phage tail protein [Yersinia hibernica]|uniref:phage tail protein n=1 Tax=Yersinia hibernica TaxID=2339259 RepID=UPI00042E58B9|nr:tail fiber protein [Yersinia hibernica]
MQKIGDIPNTRADSNGEFTDGNVAGGVPPTILPAEWFNTLQRELMSILTAAEIEADSDAFNQVLLSIKKLVSEGIPELKDASLTQKGIVQLSSETDSTSEVLAATPKAVKAAIDAALPVGGTAKAAEKLATARKISGVDFDGSKDITLPFINTTDTNIQLAGALTAGSDIRAARLLSKSDLIAGEGRAEGHATLAVDGNVHGTVWGGALSTYLANRTDHRVRAWAAVQGNGTIISSFGFAAINRTNVGGYNFTMSTSNGAYAVTVGINGGSQNGAADAHSANIWNRTPNSFSIQNANDGGSSYNWRDWPEFYVIVVGP